MVEWKVESWVSQSIFTWSPKPHSTCGYLSLNAIYSNSFSYPNTPKTVLKKLSNLYKGTTTDIMFRQYAKAFKSSQSREVFCRLNKSQLPDANTGFEFFKKCFIG